MSVLGTHMRVDGYTVWDCIRETEQSEVYTGIRNADGLRVVLKAYRSSRGTAEQRCLHEYQMLDRIGSPDVVRPVEVVSDARGSVLVVERFSGFPLSRYVKGPAILLADFCWIALGVSRSLAAVHAARVIHKDIKLSNILVDPVHQRICLIDFGISAEFGRAEHVASPEVGEGTMQYIAPEQTGRMGLGIDFRTDLYSLGASFYELLTGQPPFGQREGAELVLAHIAMRPRSVCELLPHASPTLSRLIDRLLEKDPELRYQTAQGLAADLEQCQKQLETSGEIDPDFELGGADRSDRLRFPNKLYGRDHEVSVLCEAQARAASGAVEWVLLEGRAGIGKSSLVGVVREPVVRAGGYLAEAKFDPDRRERPYAGFAEAIDGFVNQILAGSHTRLPVWRDTLAKELGALAGVLVDLVPSLGFLIDDFPEVPRVGPREQRERLNLAVTRLVRAAGRTPHPLVFFFDDLQWADEGSLSLLDAVARESGFESLLVIVGYRPLELEENGAASQLVALLSGEALEARKLSPAPLCDEDISCMLADVLGRPASETEWLAREVARKSQRNPLLVRRLLFHLWDRDLIRYQHPNGWVWDRQRISEAEITDDVAALVAARVDALPADARALVELASLVGTVFDVEILVRLGEVGRVEALQQLMGLVEQGLIAPCREGFKFVHDRIREAAKSRLDLDHRTRLHHRVANVLLADTPAERLPDVLFEVADHLIAALPLLSAEERIRALELLSQAAHKGLAKGASSAALHYSRNALRLLEDADWRERFSVVFELQLRAADAAVNLQQFDFAADRLELLRKYPLDPLEQAQVRSRQVSIASVTTEVDAVDIALSALREFDIRWPAEPSWLRIRLDMAYTNWRIRGPRDRSMFTGVPAADLSWIAPLLIIRTAAAPFNLRSNRLYALATSYTLRAYRRHWPVNSPALVLAAYANLSISIHGDVRRAQELAQAAEVWLEERPAADTRAHSHLILYSLVYAWVRPRRALLGPLAEVVAAERELGNIEYTLMARFRLASETSFAGVPLAQAAVPLAELVEVERRTSRSTGVIMRHAYALLSAESESPLDWSSEEASLRSMLDSMQISEIYSAIHVVAVLSFFGRFELVSSICERLDRELHLAGGLGTMQVEHVFYQGLAASGMSEISRTSRERMAHRRLLRRSLRKLRTWARKNGDFLHMARLLEAELKRGHRSPAAASQLYEEAARMARRVGYVHHVALCHERKSELLAASNRSTAARTPRAAAIEAYREWGAHAKVNLLAALDPA